jgi:hypothetical protein
MEISDLVWKFRISNGYSGSDMEILDHIWIKWKLPFCFGNSGYYQNHNQMKQESENNLQTFDSIHFSFKIFAAKILPALLVEIWILAPEDRDQSSRSSGF